MIDQGYDRASSMTGKGKDFQAVITETCPQTMYVYCCACLFVVTPLRPRDGGTA